MISISLVTCHCFGRSALQGVLGSSVYEQGRVHISSLITVESSVARELVGPRWADLHEYRDLAPRLEISDDLRLNQAWRWLERNCLPNVLLVVGWPRLVAPAVLYAFRTSGAYLLAAGMHPSPLPHGRGMSPVSWTILDEMPTSAVTVFELEDSADSGPIVEQVHFGLDKDETASSLFGKVIHAHARAGDALATGLANGTLDHIDQDEDLVRRWPKLRLEHRTVTLAEPTAEIILKDRAFRHPYEKLIHGPSGKVLSYICPATTETARRVADSTPGALRPGPNGFSIATTGDGVLIVKLSEDVYEMERPLNEGILDPTLRPNEPDRAVDRRYVGVVLTGPTGHVFLQQRDNRPDIVNPGMITLFGGVLEHGESDTQAALREIREELDISLVMEALAFLGYIDKVESDGSITRCVIFFCADGQVMSATLHEGERILEGQVADFLASPSISPVCRAALEAVVARGLLAASE